MIRLSRPPASISGQIFLPFSKSILNRCLVIKALAGDNLVQVLEPFKETSIAHDTCLMLNGLTTKEVNINLEDAGTAMRFLTAYYAIRPEHHMLTGTNRMKERPINGLVTALQNLGAKITYTEHNGFPPLYIEGGGLSGGVLNAEVNQSSQYLSALLMIAPYLPGGLTIKWSQNLVSADYVRLTVGLMQQWGAKVTEGVNQITVAPGFYTPGLALQAEADWSAASYWFVLVSLLPGSLLYLPHLFAHSLQGDKIMADWMQNFGVTTTATTDGCKLESQAVALPKVFEQDFSACPDLVPAMAVACAAHGVKGVFYGTAHLRHKESDRIAALQHELARINTRLIINPEGVMFIDPQKWVEPITAFDTYKDHRMAMCMAAFACLTQVEINGADVVKKSYPAFWTDLQLAGFSVK